MYDDLVKRLWECASGECFNCSQYTPTTNASVCQKELMKQAADAIEELSAIREEQKAQIILMAAEEKPCWIPVTERLPEEGVSVQVCFRSQGGKAQTVSERFVDNRNQSYWSGLCGMKPTHWMPLQEPPKEE